MPLLVILPVLMFLLYFLDVNRRDHSNLKLSIKIPQKREKIFCVTTYLKTELFKTLHAKFCGATGSVNKLCKKTETPRSSRKLSARFPDNECK